MKTFKFELLIIKKIPSKIDGLLPLTSNGNVVVNVINVTKNEAMNITMDTTLAEYIKKANDFFDSDLVEPIDEFHLHSRDLTLKPYKSGNLIAVCENPMVQPLVIDTQSWILTPDVSIGEMILSHLNVYLTCALVTLKDRIELDIKRAIDVFGEGSLGCFITNTNSAIDQLFDNIVAGNYIDENTPNVIYEFNK